MPRQDVELAFCESDWTVANASNALAAIAGASDAAEAKARRQEALSKMAEAAERYVKVFTAAKLLRWSIDKYREEKQGPLLAAASDIFGQLTLGSFAKLIIDFEGDSPKLLGRRAGGQTVEVSGMSDGSRDQLYLALRLAALHMHLGQEHSHPMPFIADDLFINYDDKRSRAGLKALKDLSAKTQVIFLTHHDHMIPVVRDVVGDELNVVEL